MLKLILQSRTTNAAKAEVKGVEIDAQYFISDNFSATLSYTHMNAKYKDFTRLTAGASNIANAGIVQSSQTQAVIDMFN